MYQLHKKIYKRKIRLIIIQNMNKNNFFTNYNLIINKILSERQLRQSLNTLSISIG